MRKQKKWIFLGVIALCLVAAVFGYYQYNKPRAGVASASSDYTLSATDLFTAFSTDEAAANSRYTNKVITVEGVVTDIQQSENNILLLLKVSDVGGISCSLAKVPKEMPKSGETVKVKGRCTGFLMDVNLVDAIIIDKP